MPNTTQIKSYANDPMAFFEYAFLLCGLTMAPFQLERFRILAEGGLALANGRKPKCWKIWLEAVKGASKDGDIALFLIWLVCFTKVPIDGQVAAVDEDQSKEMWKAVRAWLRVLVWLHARVRLLANKLICDSTNSTITFVASDAAGGAHGSRCQLYVINEIVHIQKTEFWQTLLDNSVKTNSLVIVATNAGFIGTEAWNLREHCRMSDQCAFHQFNGPVPWQDPAKLESRRRTSTLSHYLRLFENVWSAGLGDAIEDSDILAAIDNALSPHTMRIPKMGYIGGIDLGIKSDHSAFCVIAKHQPSGSQPNYRLASMKTWAPPIGGKVDLEAVEAEVLTAHSTFKLQAVSYDPWQAQLMADRLAKRGIRMIETAMSGKNLDLLAKNLIEIFRSRLFTMYDCPRLVADLRRLSIIERPYGYKLEATRDKKTGHADSAIALTLALLAARDHCSTMGGSWSPINTSELVGSRGGRVGLGRHNFDSMKSRKIQPPGIHWPK